MIKNHNDKMGLLRQFVHDRRRLYLSVRIHSFFLLVTHLLSAFTQFLNIGFNGNPSSVRPGITSLEVFEITTAYRIAH